MISALPIMLPAYAEIFLLVMACVVMLVDLYLPDSKRDVTYWLSLLTLIGAGVCTVAVTAAMDGQASGAKPGIYAAYTFNDMFVADFMSSVLKMFVYIAVALCLVYSRSYLAARNLYRGEFFVLTLFCTLGMMVLISANHFLTLYLGLELMSLCLYSLIALQRDSAVSTEAAMKYFVLGALASGLLLYGLSMIYGATGTLDISKVAAAVQHMNEPGGPSRSILIFGMVFSLAGIAFKLGAVPFHMWIPDVYHGAPTAMTLIVSSAPKLAAFAMAIRLLVGALGTPQLAGEWQQMLVILAVLSMAIGNLAAIAQTNLKRMLAYSTISHMGFMLLGLLSGVVGGNTYSTADAYGAAMFYAITYVLMSLAGFGMIALLSRAGFEAEEISDFKGLNRKSPWFAFIMLLTMFSLAGIPPTVGFYAKVAVFSAVLGAGDVWLAVVAVIFSLIGAFYYVRVVKVMYFDEPQDSEPVRANADMSVLLSANGLAMLALGLFPGPLLQLCFSAAQHLG